MLIAAGIFTFVSFLSFIIAPLFKELVLEIKISNTIKKSEVDEMKRANDLRELALELKNKNSL
jgi:hypothetical protein